MHEPVGILGWSQQDAQGLDDAHRELFGRAFRRIGRYVKLAQVGAVRCIKRADVQVDPRRTGIFFASGLGNTEDVVPLAESILDPDRPWASPMAFAGCVGNAAAFYVARTLGLEGPNVTVSQEELSFEGALLDAILALHAGEVDHALVGGVDLRTGDEADHRRRIGAVGIDGEIGDGSAWMLLGKGGGPGIVSVRIGRDLGPLPATNLLAGWRTDLPGRDRRLVPIATGMRLVDVLEGSAAGTFTHVQRSASGREARVELRR